MMDKENRKDVPPLPFDVTDPKPPVIRSGHLENRRSHKNRISY